MVKKWYKSDGHKIAKPVLGTLSTISGVAKAPLLTKMVGSAFVKKGAKYVLAPFTAYMVYNNLRADGFSHHDAAALASIEAANPLPIGVEELNDAGKFYNKTVAAAKELGYGNADPEHYRGTMWYDAAKNRSELNKLRQQTGACNPNAM